MSSTIISQLNSIAVSEEKPEINKVEKKSAQDRRDAAVIAQIDKVNVNVKDRAKSLSILANEVIKKLNELLKDDLPEGISSLKPEDHTSEKTAQRIVDGVTGLFTVFQKQNPNLEGEELIASFMSTIRGGVEKGAGEALDILHEMGAFEIEGVEDGINETMRLVDEKLKAFEENYRRENGLIGEEPQDSN